MTLTGDRKRILQVWLTLIGHYRLHRAQGIFLLLGLSLGVAILLGTLLLNHAASDSFNRAQSTIGGTVIANISPANGAKTFSEQHYITLRKLGYDHLMPTVEDTVQLKSGQLVTIKGIDIVASLHRDFGPTLADHTINQQVESQTEQVLPMVFSYPPYQLLVSKSQAKLLNLTKEQQLQTNNGTPLPPLTIVSDDFGINYELLCDLRCAQGLFGLTGQLSNIILTQSPGNITELEQHIERISDGTLKLTIANKNPENQAMGDAFFLNITAVSFLAFLVGCFIAFNAVRFSLIERQQLVQRLRLLGVSNSEVIIALIIELLAWTLMASIVGGILGFYIAESLTANVGLTLRQMFSSRNLLNLDSPGLIGTWWLLSLAISFIATSLATAGPFYQLSKQKPLENRQQQQGNYRPLFIFGISAIVIGALLTLAPQSQNLGFAITFCWFLGAALLVPQSLNFAYYLIGQIIHSDRFPKLHWAISDGKQNPQRLSFAMMAFTVAIAAGIGVNTMVSSFKYALESHLDLVLAEDIYLSPSDQQSAAIKQYLDQHPDVILAYRFLTTNTLVTALQTDEQQNTSQRVSIRSVTDHQLRHESMNMADKTADLWQKFHHNQGIIINQTLAFRLNLQVGDKVKFNQSDTEILGIYYNYGVPRSAIAISQSWFKQQWPNINSSEIGVFIDPSKKDSSAAIIEQLKIKFKLKDHQYFQPQQIKQLAINIFKQTFNVTQLLIVFTLLIAAIGIYCACYAAQLHNLRQLTLLKILGVNQRQLVGLSILQLGFNALIAALIAVPLGLLIAWASVAIVLQYSFGWHFPLVIEIPLLVAIAVSAIFIAIIAGAIPLYQQSRKTAIHAFREAL